MDADEGQPTLEAWAMFWRHERTFDLFVSPALHGRPMHETVSACLPKPQLLRCAPTIQQHIWRGPGRGHAQRA